MAESLLRRGREAEVGALAVGIESRTNLLFSFEKMALRDAVRSEDGARIFAHGLYDSLHGKGDTEARFNRWCAAVAILPRGPSPGARGVPSRTMRMAMGKIGLVV